MARESSRKGGKRPRTGSARARATRPPIIDMDPISDNAPAGAGRWRLDFEAIKRRLSGWLEWCVAWMVTASRFCLERPAMALAIGVGIVLLAALIATRFGESPSSARLKAPPSATPAPPAPSAERRIVRLERDLLKLNRDIAALGPQLRAGIARDLGAGDARAAQQARELAALKAAQDKTKGQLSGAEKQLAGLPDAIAKKLQPIDGGLKALDARLKAFEAQIGKLNKTLSALGARIAALENAQNRIKRTAADLQAHRLSASDILALQNAGRALIAALGRSEPYSDALQAYARIIPDDIAVKLLQPYAKAGVPTMDQLTAQARRFAGSGDPTDKTDAGKTQSGLWDRLGRWSQKLVRIRRKSDTLAGEQRVWENAYTKLEAGDLAGALEYALSRPVRGAKKTWAAQAQARLLVNRQIASLKTRLAKISAAGADDKVN
jgi:hypothetical protein